MNAVVTPTTIQARGPRIHSVRSLRRRGRRPSIRPADARREAALRGGDGDGGHAARSLGSMRRRNTSSRPRRMRWFSVDGQAVVGGEAGHLALDGGRASSARTRTMYDAQVAVALAGLDGRRRRAARRARRPCRRPRRRPTRSRSRVKLSSSSAVGADADEPAAVEDRDVVADPLDVVEDVGRVEDRRSRPGGRA